MGFRFRKSFRIAPGVRINLSKTGVSTSIGGKGATVNVSKRGVRGTVGIPGSGLSYSERLDGGSTGQGPGSSGTPKTGRGGKAIMWIIALIILGVIIF